MQIPSYTQFRSLQTLQLLRQLSIGGGLGMPMGAGTAASKKDMVEVLPGFYARNDPRVVANFRKNFDKDGEVLNSHGIAGMCINGKDPAEWHQIIDISEEGREKLFNMVKSEFIENNGVLNGDTTQRSEVYAAYYRTIPKEDRLKAGWTMNALERDYRQALLDAVRQSNPGWDYGQSFDSSALGSVTRESVEGGRPCAGPLDSRA